MPAIGETNPQELAKGCRLRWLLIDCLALLIRAFYEVRDMLLSGSSKAPFRLLLCKKLP